jgi:phenylacetate-coenzyme A ligase PaaK-like adenylate-forming protein
LIVTDFTNTSSPIIRYRTKDIIKNVKRQGGIIKEFEIVSRNDDLIKLRGAFVSKVKLGEILSNFSLDFIVYFTIKNNSDFIEIVLPKILENKKSKIQKSLKEVLGNNKMIIYFKDKLIIPKTNSNKPKYFLDLRD